ncbi:MAG: hypothetical protein CMJ18_28345 [Phycisphaeraceae bacterium]|nr:hypothetical protein [Phycisphaeraceae bacterium]
MELDELPSPVSGAVSGYYGSRAHLNNDGPVFFLAGTGGTEETRRIDLPTDRPILLPLINAIWYATPVIPPEDDTDNDTIDNDTESLFFGAPVTPNVPADFMETFIFDPTDQLNFSINDMTLAELDPNVDPDLFTHRVGALGTAIVEPGSQADLGLGLGLAATTSYPDSYSGGFWLMFQLDPNMAAANISYGGSRVAVFDVTGDNEPDLFPFSNQVHINVPEPLTASLGAIAVGLLGWLATGRRRL